MNGLQTLFLESILNVKIGPLNCGAAEFEGHISSSDISTLCDQGLVFRQDASAPVTDVEYLAVYVDDGKLFVAIDPSTNTIVVHKELKEERRHG